MNPATWSLVAIPRLDRRSWQNRFSGKKAVMTDNSTPNIQIAVPVVQQPTDGDLETAVKNYRAAETEMVLLVFDATMAKLNFDPFAPAKVPSRPRRDRRADYRDAKSLTSRVWASINADGSINPNKAIPSCVTNTGELATIKRS